MRISCLQLQTFIPRCSSNGAERYQTEPNVNVYIRAGTIEKIIRKSHEAGAKVLIDGAQAASHISINVQKLNVDGRGELLGEFRGEDRILVVSQNGLLKTIAPELTTHFNDDMIVLEKWIPKKPLSVVYFDGKKEKYFAKRFLVENENKEEMFISANKGSFLELISTDWKPVIEVVFNKVRNKEQRESLKIIFDEFITIKGIKAQGNQLSSFKIKQVNPIEPIEYVPPIETPANEIEVIDEHVVDENIVNNVDNNDKLDDSTSNQVTLF